MLTLTKLNLLDIVALKNDLPQHRLQSGQVGTIVEILAPEVYEIEFSDNDGQTYAMQALPAHQLLKLHYNLCLAIFINTAQETTSQVIKSSAIKSVHNSITICKAQTLLTLPMKSKTTPNKPPPTSRKQAAQA